MKKERSEGKDAHKESLRLRHELEVPKEPLSGQSGSERATDDAAAREQTAAVVTALGLMKERLLFTSGFSEKLRIITDSVVEVFQADFARIWITAEADLCDRGCIHAAVTEGKDVCRDRSRCLHLVASSGRYTQIDGSHRRVPMGSYKIGRVAAGDDPWFLTNDVVHDRRIHNNEWARALGLVAFAGYRLLSSEGKPIGVLALFSRQAITPEEEVLLRDTANVTSHVIQAGMAEEALRESEDKYRHLIEASPEAMYIRDEEGAISYMNPAGLRLLGAIHPEEVIGRSAMEFVLPEYHEAVRERVRRIIERNETVPLLEEKYRRLDGSLLDVEVTAVPFSEQGKRGMQVLFRDITQRKRTEEALRRQTDETRLLMKSMANAFVIWGVIFDAEGKVADIRFDYFNDAYARESGLKLEDVQGKTVREVRPDTEQGWFDAYGEVALTGQPKSFEMYHVSTNGIYACNAYRPSDSPERVCCVFENVTERRQAEAALERARTLLEAVIEQSPVPMVVVSAPDHVLRYANRAAAEFLGMLDEPHPRGQTIEEAFRRKSWRDFTPGGTEVDPNDLPLSRALRGETTHRIELSVIRKDGTQRWEIVDGTPIYSPTGELLAGMIVFPDITEQRLAETALKESQERLALVLQGAELGSWDWNVQTGEVFFDERWAQMLGCRVDEIEPQVGSWEKLVHPDDMPAVREALAAHLDGRTALYETEHRLRHKSGSWVWVLDKGRVITRDAAGRPLRAAGTHLDITERKQAEQERLKLQDQLQQAMKMEAIGRLAGGVAHDFNNLLTAIIGNIELARMQVPSSAPVVQQLDEVAKAADSAASLTRQLLAFSRKQLIEPRVLNLNDLVSNLQKMLMRLIGEDIALETILGKDLGSVRVDPGQFEQVLVNLAVNARDSMLGGGRLQIETANVDLDPDYCAHHPGLRPGPFVLLAISDTGHGMSDEVKMHIFEPFFTTKPKGRGTGLGLATIFGTVKQAGGAIEVYSEVGMGTVFKIYLPRVELEAKEFHKQEAKPDLPKGTETILLVEDEDSVRALATKILERLGYNVLHAANGAEALAVAGARIESIDLMMTDVVMPGLNGKELARQLAGIHPETQVLFTSGYTEDVIAHHGVIEENLNFIGKPYSLHGLARKIRDVLGKLQ